MCAAALQYCNIQCVVFGCTNQRFGGVVNTCMNNVQYTYNVIAGIYSDEAIELLKLFYERGNPNAPEHKRTRPLVDRQQKLYAT